nr:PQQ-dependent sugar dehydrogenase [Robertkochia marina]
MEEAPIEIETPEQVNYTTELIVDDLTIPWGMEFLPDGRMLITEQNGNLILFDNGKKTKVSNVPEVYYHGQGGLLDIKLHPDYQQNGWIYLTYASSEGEGEGGHTALMRARLKDSTLTDNELLYKATPNTTKSVHFGSRMAFDKEGMLYFSIGERGAREVNPQDLTRDGGKVYRLHDDGRVPTDNPFVGQPNAVEAAYSYGHRNPQGMAIHPETGEVWTHEHGPQGGDEINIIKKGANYGWPVISYGINYDGTSFTELTEKEGMEQPLYYWVPSIAPSGMAFVTSDRYPEWKGSLLAGSLKFLYLERLELNGNSVTKREKLFEGVGRLRNVKQGPDGYLYLAVEGKGILRIVPKS